MLIQLRSFIPVISELSIYLAPIMVLAGTTVDREHIVLSSAALEKIDTTRLQLDESMRKIETHYRHWDTPPKGLLDKRKRINTMKLLLDKLSAGQVSPTSTQHTLNHMKNHNYGCISNWCDKLIDLMDLLRPLVTVTSLKPMPKVAIPALKIHKKFSLQRHIAVRVFQTDSLIS